MTELPFKFDQEVVYAIADWDLPEEVWDDEADEYITLSYEEGRERQEKIREQFDVIVNGDREISTQFWVFVHKDTGRMFRFDVAYDSWNGTDLSYIDESDVYEVTAVDRTVRFYEPINS